VLLLAVALLAACGGGKSGAKSNGEASKPAMQVLADAKRAAVGATSLHVAGNIKSGGTPTSLDLSIAKAKGAKGSMSTSGFQFDLIRVGNAVYIRGSDAFLKHFAGGAASLFHGKWLKASAKTGGFASLTPLTTPSTLFGAIANSHGKLANDGLTTYKGQQVVEIRDTSDNSKLYVAATGTAYPVAIVGGKKGDSGAITFGDWNQPVSISAPKGALDLAKLGAG
jgi:hypothetical protein